MYCIDQFEPFRQLKN